MLSESVLFGLSRCVVRKLTGSDEPVWIQGACELHNSIEDFNLKFIADDKLIGHLMVFELFE